MASFWSTLKKPIFILAPMEDVTDCAFREMFARYSVEEPRSKNQDPKANNFVLFTEFVSTEGLMHPEGRKKLSIDLQFTEIQRPIVAQIWGADPEKFYRVAEYLVELGFDGIDINMGCPQSKEIQAGSCAALIRQPKLAQEIIRATKKGAGALPVSVKTRLGYSKLDEMEEWMKHLLEMDIAALTLHARTKQEMSKVPAHWDKIKEAVEIRNRENASVLIIGNGDVKSRQEGLDRIAETGADGVMIGRGAFGNPWLFNSSGPVAARLGVPTIEDGMPWHAATSEDVGTGLPVRHSPSKTDDGGQPVQSSTERLETVPYTAHVNPAEKLRVMLEHAELFEKMYSGIKSFSIMRKHFKAYCSGFPGASELRAKLMETTSFEETKQIVEEYLK